VDLLRYRDLCLRGGNVTDTPVRTLLTFIGDISIHISKCSMTQSASSFPVRQLRESTRPMKSAVSLFNYNFTTPRHKFKQIGPKKFLASLELFCTWNHFNQGPDGGVINQNVFGHVSPLVLRGPCAGAPMVCYN
jgi:hypothetical protein